MSITYLSRNHLTVREHPQVERWRKRFVATPIRESLPVKWTKTMPDRLTADRACLLVWQAVTITADRKHTERTIMFRTLFGFSALALALSYMPTVRAEDAKADDIVTTAVNAGDFKYLVTAVKAADLVDTLKSAGPFTVLAPTDEAFEKLIKQIGKEKFDEILKDKKALAKILTYHVVKGDVMSKDVVKLDKASTVEGADLMIAVKGGKVMLNGMATVIKADIKCSNGVIHVIDTVLMPPAK